jgi:hypothetical protein
MLPIIALVLAENLGFLVDRDADIAGLMSVTN